jgi:AmmeMemoRadiSam system protein B
VNPGVKRADFAGTWYPGNETDCRMAIEDFAGSALACPENTDTVIGGIVPHAGWIYSGSIAYNVIKCLRLPKTPDTFIIFGRHLHPGSDNYIMVNGAWATPLGNLEIDSELASAVSREFKFNIETTDHYEPDNTIELQLPFIKYLFPDIKIVPIGLPPRNESLKIAKRTAEISKELNRHTIVLGSTDLTHYGYNYGYVPKGVGEEAVKWVKDVNDRRLVERILKMEEKGVIEEATRNQNACCSGAVGAAIITAKELGAKQAKQMVYSTSYDVRPDNSFVGYVGVLLFDT